MGTRIRSIDNSNSNGGGGGRNIVRMLIICSISISSSLILMVMIEHGVEGVEGVGGGGSGGLTCERVVHSLMACKGYLVNGGQVASTCCNSVRDLNRKANSRSARQTACSCMKLAAKAYKVDPHFASRLPSACNLNIGYAVSYSTNCRRVQ